jgi:streptomycin 6-kinase
VPPVDLTETKAIAERVAREWHLELGKPFALSRYSYVAPVGDDAVLKVAWEEDEESLHEVEALERWAGDGAVRLLRRDQESRALLEERARPGNDISALPENEATAIAVDVATRLWRPAAEPFRWVGDYVPRWLDDDPGELTPLARELYASLEIGRAWLVHGDFHHHNILEHGDRFVAIDPKPYLADREYDVYTWLHNPLPYTMDRETTERRIAAFVAAGLDDYRIRAWAIIRGAYLGGEGVEAEVLGGLLA